MKRIISIIFVSAILLGCSCTKEDNSNSTKTENGVIIDKPYLWWNQEEEHDNFIITTPFTYKRNFIAETHEGGTSYMSLQNVLDGSILWKWSGYINPYDIDIRTIYATNNKLVWQSGPRTYCINLDNGKLNWTAKYEKPQFFIESGNESECFLIQNHPSDSDIFPGIEILNIDNGNRNEKIIPPFKNYTNQNVINEYGSIYGAQSYFRNNDENLIISYAEPNNYYNSKGFLGLFNRKSKLWKYTLLLNDKKVAGELKIYNEKIYFVIGDAIQCRSVWSGDSVWHKDFKGNFVYGGYMIDHGTLYCAAEGDGYYALDAETGAIKWKGERAPGTSSRMVVLNGVLYYINGGDGRLWALDAATGKTLWRLKSPDGYSFKREINVMQGDGERKRYVLTSTWHGACAYEAEQ